MSVYLSLFSVYLSLCVMSNHSTSKCHLILAKLSVNLMRCCIKPSANYVHILAFTKVGRFGKVRNSDACVSKNAITYLRRTYRAIVKRFTTNNNLRRVFCYGKTYFSKLIPLMRLYSKHIYIF